ncbi:MAG: UDP-N-acetylmuramate dehydrogenase [Actinomycetota bacterium]
MNLKAIANEWAGRVRGRVALDHPLAGLTTYRLGGPAALYLEPEDADDVAALADVLHDAGEHVPLLPMGRGSNMVISDQGFDGIVIRLGMKFAWIRAKAGDGAAATGMIAGASTSLPLLANWAARRSLTGMEFAVAIPGSVGGGVRMNAGAHGTEISDTLESVQLFDLVEHRIATLGAGDLGLSYRRSNLTSDQVVLDATFDLTPGDEADIRDSMETYRRHRVETQPGALQNAGSVFKNPEGDWAGRLVEAAGLKGFRVGTVAVSELHANFFVAEDGGRAQDVYDLVYLVRARVQELFGVDLEPEIRFVGMFEAPERSRGPW